MRARRRPFQWPAHQTTRTGYLWALHRHDSNPQDHSLWLVQSIRRPPPRPSDKLEYVKIFAYRSTVRLSIQALGKRDHRPPPPALRRWGIGGTSREPGSIGRPCRRGRRTRWCQHLRLARSGRGTGGRSISLRSTGTPRKCRFRTLSCRRL